MAACSNPEFDARTDTVYSLDTPSVTAKAYPGVNIVSWKPVSGATGYEVSVYEEGLFKRTLRYENPDNYSIDTVLVNGKKYTYYVEALSASDPANMDREVYAKNSRGEASVTAIVPPAGTSALELPAYESGYNGTAKEVKGDKFVVSAENVKISVDEGVVYVNIPTKAYLKYSVSAYDPNFSREIPNLYPINYTPLKDYNSNNVTQISAFSIDSAGKYKVVVKVYAFNGFYYKESELEVGEINIETLSLDSETYNASAKYLSDGKTARISFTPAQKGGVNVPTSWYKVYRRIKGEDAVTLVSGDVKEAVSVNSPAPTYYIDDEIADTTKDYDYIIVVEYDGKHGDSQTGTLYSISSLSLGSETYNASATYLSDGKTARISFYAATTKDGKAVPTSWYKVYRRIEDEVATTKVSGDVKVKVDNSTTTYYTYYIDDEITDKTKNYEYIIVVENDGKYGTTTKAELDIDTDLGLRYDDDVRADYLHSINHFAEKADNTVRITFSPATKNVDNTTVPTSCYKVYRNKEDELEQTEITSATNKIMQVNADPNTYVIYDDGKSIDPSKGYVYTVVVENEGKTAVQGTDILNGVTKPTIRVSQPSGDIVSAYNDVKWTFYVSINTENGGKAEDVGKVKVSDAYILVVPTTQQTPKINEIIAKGEKISISRDTTYVDDTTYRYECSKSNLSEGKAYVVVAPMTCAGYEDSDYELSNGFSIVKN